MLHMPVLPATICSIFKVDFSNIHANAYAQTFAPELYQLRAIGHIRVHHGEIDLGLLARHFHLLGDRWSHRQSSK